MTFRTLIFICSHLKCICCPPGEVILDEFKSPSGVEKKRSWGNDGKRGFWRGGDVCLDWSVIHCVCYSLYLHQVSMSLGKGRLKTFILLQTLWFIKVCCIMKVNHAWCCGYELKYIFNFQGSWVTEERNLHCSLFFSHSHNWYLVLKAGESFVIVP